MSNIFAWIYANWALVTAGLLILIRLIESYMLTKKFDLSILKEFLTLR